MFASRETRTADRHSISDKRQRLADQPAARRSCTVWFYEPKLLQCYNVPMTWLSVCIAATAVNSSLLVIPLSDMPHKFVHLRNQLCKVLLRNAPQWAMFADSYDTHIQRCIFYLLVSTVISEVVNSIYYTPTRPSTRAASHVYSRRIVHMVGRQLVIRSAQPLRHALKTLTEEDVHGASVREILLYTQLVDW
jgi:hypothetical protein